MPKGKPGSRDRRDLLRSERAYYLNHQNQLDEYIVRQRQAADELQERISADPAQQGGISAMRERIKARMAHRQQTAP